MATLNRYKKAVLNGHEVKGWGGALKGAGSGAASGAAIGSVVPIVGPALGAIIGGVSGALFGHFNERKMDKANAKAQAKMTGAQRTAAIQRTQLAAENEESDELALNNFRLNNNNLFMKKGGKISNTSSGYTPSKEDRALYPIKFGTPTLIGRGRMSQSGSSDTESFGNWADVNQLQAFANSKLNKGKVRQRFAPIALTAEEAKNVIGSQTATAGYVPYEEDRTKPAIGYKTKSGQLMVGKYITDSSGNEILTYIPGSETDLWNMSDYLSNTNESKMAAKHLTGKKTGYATRRDTLIRRQLANYKSATGHTEDFFNLHPAVTSSAGFKPATVSLNQIKASGGRLNKKVGIPSANEISLGDGAYLLTDEGGNTSGTHESGNNIPLRKKGKTVAYAEPGEVVVGDFVLSKRMGENGISYADEYMQLEQSKQAIEARQKALPKLNDNRVSKSGRFMKNNKPMAFTGLALNAVTDVAGTIGNLIMSNKTLNRQKDFINRGLRDIDAYKPTLNKIYTDTSQVDMSNELGDIEQSFGTANSEITTGVSNSGVAGALRSNAALQKASALRRVYAEGNRYNQYKRSQNIAGINQNNAVNADTINRTNQFKLQGRLDAYGALANAEAARLNNVQSAFGELSNISSDYATAQSISDRYKDTIGEDAVPQSWGKIGFPTWIKKGKSFARGGKLRRTHSLLNTHSHGIR
jgi:hypothetical protein